MTRQTFSTDKFIEELEAWETETSNQACFPKVSYCPFETAQGEGVTSMLCGHCPFASHNRKHFINTLKTIKLLELDHVDVSKTSETNEVSK